MATVKVVTALPIPDGTYRIAGVRPNTYIQLAKQAIPGKGNVVLTSLSKSEDQVWVFHAKGGNGYEIESKSTPGTYLGLASFAESAAFLSGTTAPYQWDIAKGQGDTFGVRTQGAGFAFDLNSADEVWLWEYHNLNVNQMWTIYVHPDPRIPPPPNPVPNPNYDPELDEPRPDTVDNYLKYYDTVFLVDDSGSMAEGTKWPETSSALSGIADLAMKYDTDGVDMYFMNNAAKATKIKGAATIASTFAIIGKPVGGTPTGAKVKERLDAHIAVLNAAVGKPEYRKIKPLDLIVLTDGVPTDAPLPVLEAAAAQMRAAKHHPNHIGIQFVQIGNDAGAGAALIALTKGNVNGMVDTIPYHGPVTAAELERILLGGIHPNIRTTNP